MDHAFKVIAVVECDCRAPAAEPHREPVLQIDLARRVEVEEAADDLLAGERVAPLDDVLAGAAGDGASLQVLAGRDAKLATSAPNKLLASNTYDTRHTCTQNEISYMLCFV